MSQTLVIRPFQTPARGVAQVPGSKSITNRALILAALADGVTLFTGRSSAATPASSSPPCARWASK
jgi:5-enolpyruvylshikimate-3-phosphate synthase